MIRSRFVRTILFPLITVLLFFSLFEISLRIAGFEYTGIWTTRGGEKVAARIYEYHFTRHWKLQDNLRSEDWKGISLSTNRFGFRENEFDSRKGRGVIRLIFLGDSCIFGDEVEVRDTLPKQVERMLAMERPYRVFECFNLGVPGYSTFQMKRVLREIALRLEPDVVVIYTGHADQRMVTSPARENERTAISTLLVAPFSGTRIFHLYRFLLFKIHPDVTLPSPEDSRTREEGGIYLQNVTPEEHRDNIVEMVEMARKRSAYPIILSSAVRNFEIHKGYREADLEAAFRSGAPILLPHQAYALDSSAFRELFFADEIHPSPFGHKCYAELIVRHLIEEGIL